MGKFTFLTLHCEQGGRDEGRRRILKRQERRTNNERMKRSDKGLKGERTGEQQLTERIRK